MNIKELAAIAKEKGISDEANLHIRIRNYYHHPQKNDLSLMVGETELHTFKYSKHEVNALVIHDEPSTSPQAVPGQTGDAPAKPLLNEVQETTLLFTIVYGLGLLLRKQAEIVSEVNMGSEIAMKGASEAIEMLKQATAQTIVNSFKLIARFDLQDISSFKAMTAFMASETAKAKGQNANLEAKIKSLMGDLGLTPPTESTEGTSAFPS